MTTLARRRVTCAILSVLMTVQPVMAAEMVYRFPLVRGTGVPLPPKPPKPPGVGNGVVDAGSDPVYVDLQLSPSNLRFEVGGGMPLEPKSSLLTNMGTGPAALAPITSPGDFQVTHDCPSVLEAGAACAISAVPSSNAGDVEQGLTLAAADAESVTLSLSSFVQPPAVPAPRLSMTPDLIQMGTTDPGTTLYGSTTISNVGKGPASLTALTQKRNGFDISTDCPAQLMPGASCTVTAQFSSFTPRTHSFSLNIASTTGASLGYATFIATVRSAPALSPELQLTPSSLTFDLLAPGATSTQRTKLTNRGTVPAELTDFSSSDDFAVSHNCPSTLAVDASCDVQATFRARIEGSRPAFASRIGAQDKKSAQLYLQGAVTGVNRAPAAMPERLDFGSLPAGERKTLTASLTNRESATMTLKAINVEYAPDVLTQANDCGTQLAPGASCTVSVTFAPTTAASYTGRLKVELESGQVGSIPLTGTGQKATLTVGSTKLDFGAVMMPGSSAVQGLALINSGNVPLTGLALSNPDNRLVIDYGDCRDTLDAKASCVLKVKYAPDSFGVFSGALGVRSANGGDATVSYDGAAVRVLASPESLTFPLTKTGQAAPDRSISLRNEGSQPVPLTGISVVGAQAHFNQSNNCGGELAGGATCSVAVRYSPASEGSHTGNVVVGAYGAVLAQVGLAGTAVKPELVMSATSVMLPKAYVGMPSATVDVTLNNKTAEPISFSGMGIVTGQSDFSQSNNCGVSLESLATCTVRFQMTPSKVGAVSGSWSVVSSLGTYSIALAGTGVEPAVSVTPSSLAFAKVAIGQSKVLTVTATNPGGMPMALDSVKLVAGDGIFEQSNDCGTSLPAQGSCSISVKYTPTSISNNTGRIQVALAGGQFTEVPMTGAGEGAVLAVGPASVDFGTVMLPGVTAKRSVSLSNKGNAVLTGIEISKADARLSVDSSKCGPTLAASASCVLTIEYAPGATGSFETNLKVTSANGGEATVAVKGAAVRVSATPTALTFPSTWVGQSAADQAVTVTNEGTSPLTIDGLGVSAGQEHFNQSNNCGPALAAGASCSILVRYTPAAEGTHQGALALVSAGVPLVQVSLAGTAVKPSLTLSRATIRFADTNVGTGSTLEIVTIKNPSERVAVFSKVEVVLGQAEFTQSNTCGEELVPGASCTVTLQMTPAEAAARSGIWAATTSLGTFSISMTGQGTKPVAAIEDPEALPGTEPTTPDTPDAPDTPDTPAVPDEYTHVGIKFLDTEVGSSSAVRNVAFSNRGTGPLTVSGISIVKGASDFGQSNNCGQVLAPGASCTIALLFTPSEAGARTGGLVLMSESENFYFDLQGKATFAEGKWTPDTSSDFGPVEKGTLAQRSFTFTSTGDVPVRGLATTLTGADVSMTSNTCGTEAARINLGRNATCKVTVRFAPTAYGPLVASLVGKGNLATGPAVLSLTGESPAPELKFGDAPSGDFGVQEMGSVAPRTYTLRNTGKFNDTLEAMPSFANTGFTYQGGTCAAGLVLMPAGACTVIVAADASKAGEFAASMPFRSAKGGAASLSLTSVVKLKTPALGEFKVPSKTFGAAPFTLTPPSSDSPGVFVYTSSNPDVATIDGDQLTVTGLGTATISAVQQAAGSYTASAKLDASFVVPKGAPTIEFTIPAQVFNLNPIEAAPVQLAATSNSPGAMSYASSLPARASVSGSTATLHGTGPVTITVTQAETAMFLAGTKTATLQVTAPGSTLIAAGVAWAPLGPAMYWSSANSSCESMVVGGRDDWRLPTRAELKALYANATQVPSWSFVWSIEKSPSGHYAMASSYQAGLDAGDTTGSVFRTCVLAPSVAPTVGSFSVPSKTYGVSPFAIQAPTSNNSAAFVYTSSNPDVATISGSMLTVTGIGSATITAIQPASGLYGASPVLSTTFTVTKGAPTMAFSVPNPVVNLSTGTAPPFKLAATSSNPEPITYVSSAPAIVSVVGDIATVHSLGSVTITASQPESPYFLAGSKAVVVTSAAPDGIRLVDGKAWSPVSASNVTWSASNTACQNLVAGGRSDWRLPTRAEVAKLTTSPERPMWAYVWTSEAGSPGNHYVAYVYGGGALDYPDSGSSISRTCVLP